MNKEKLMELFLEAIDRQASINIHFPQFHKETVFEPVTTEEAFVLATRFKEALNASEISQGLGGAGTMHYDIEQGGVDVCISYIPTKEEEMDSKHQRIKALEMELAQLKQAEEVSKCQ